MTEMPSDRRAGDTQDAEIFKQCPCCSRAWPTRDAFLCDSKLVVVGYQVNFEELLLGFFMFSHRACGSTIALPAESFRDLYDGPIYESRATGTDECPEYCLYESELGACLAKCECAYVREILQIVRRWPKKAQGDN